MTVLIFGHVTHLKIIAIFWREESQNLLDLEPSFQEQRSNFGKLKPTDSSQVFIIACKITFFSKSYLIKINQNTIYLVNYSLQVHMYVPNIRGFPSFLIKEEEKS